MLKAGLIKLLRRAQGSMLGSGGRAEKTPEK